MRRLLKQKAWARRTVGVLAAEYLRLVWRTSRFAMEPADPYRMYETDQPVIIGMWHGQHFLLPFLRRHYRFKVLISRHTDGEINAIAAERLGIGTVRGSGDHGRRFYAKGGVAGFKEMIESLAEGWNMALTADIPKVSRVAGLGIVKLAQISGRPIFPVSLTTSRRIVLDNWDRSEINLPFSRGAIVIGDPIRVPPDADAATLERMRSELESALNAASNRAHILADRRSAIAAGQSLGTA
ncbi:MAG: lysophospholipid acyltransferase family protein [Xanthobacteraceae bacterium]